MSFEYYMKDGLGTVQLIHQPDDLLPRSLLKATEEIAAFLSNPELTSVIIKVHDNTFYTAKEPGTGAPVIQKDLELFLGAISQGPVPIAALLSGECTGAGLAVAFSCHFRFATEKTELGFPPGQTGIVPFACLSQISGNTVSRQNVISLILSGKVISGIEALNRGLVDGVWPPEVIESQTIDFMRSLTKNRPPHLIHAVMQSINNSFVYPLTEALHRERTLFDTLIRQTLQPGKE